MTSARCTACGADAVTNGVCSRCGYAEGESNRCPHCGAVARVEPKGDGARLGWVCAVCGGPRIPGGRGGERASTPLREAKAFWGTAARARAASIAWGVFAVLATLVVIAASAKEALATSLVLAVLAIVPAVLGLRARSRAARGQAAAEEAEKRAWLAAAEDAAERAPQGITAEELAKALQIAPARADELLTQLAVHDRTRIDVGDDAEVRYSVTPRVRVGAAEEPAREEESAHDEERAHDDADETLRGSSR